MLVKGGTSIGFPNNDRTFYLIEAEYFPLPHARARRGSIGGNLNPPFQGRE